MQLKEIGKIDPEFERLFRGLMNKKHCPKREESVAKRIRVDASAMPDPDPPTKFRIDLGKGAGEVEEVQEAVRELEEIAGPQMRRSLPAPSRR